MVLARTLFVAYSDPSWAIAKTTGELERNVRIAQAILLVVLVGVVFYYLVPIGRNLRGIIVGYGFFVATIFINSTLRLYLGESFHSRWRYFQSIAWNISLVIWCATLWAYHPNPRPEAAEFEDYDSLANQTARGLSKGGGDFLRGMR